MTTDDTPVRSIVLKDDGTFPNNVRPLLLYAKAVPLISNSAERNIAALPVPQKDPVQGTGGVLPRLWQVP
jgi:uncharacterized protein YjlB